MAPQNLTDIFAQHPSPKEDVSDASDQLKELYLADFEMARLKEIRDATLLRLYLKLEKFLPKEFMFVASQGLKIIVRLRFGVN